MPQGYCKECRAHVTVRDGACLLGHSVDPATIVAGNGRHREPRSRRLIHQPLGSAAVVGVDAIRRGHSEPTPLPDLVDRDFTLAETPIEPVVPAPEPSPAPEPAPEPWARPLLGRQRLPMLELLGFTDSEEDAAIITIVEPAQTEPAKPAIKRKVRPASRPVESAPATRLGPRLADVHTGESTENTGVLVARLWEATSESSPLSDDWKPVQTVEAPHRTYRWSFISTALALAVTLALLALGAYRWPINQANELRTELAAGLDNLDEATSGLPEAAALLLDPKATAPALTGVAIPLLGFSEAANGAYGAATSNPQLNIPLVSNEPVEALTATQANLRRAADEALEIHRQLGDVLDYRILTDRALVLPATLPVEATDARISDVGVALADMLAETTEVILQLPQNEMLADHRFQLETALAEVTASVADYLSALRAENAFGASRIAREMRNTATAVRTSLATTLIGFDTWLTDALDGLELQLDAARTELQTSRS